MIIYKITNKINGKMYVGQTTRSLEERMKEHYRHDFIVIDKALKKYGTDSFLIEVIDNANDINELNEKEKYWIYKLNTLAPNGYNQCFGGDNSCGFHYRDESKNKMSESKKNKYQGIGNPFYSKKHSYESKLKMNSKRKGMSHLNEEQVKHLRESHFVRTVKNIDTGEVFDSIKEASERYRINPTHITRVCKGRRKMTGGYRWEYV